MFIIRKVSFRLAAWCIALSFSIPVSADTPRKPLASLLSVLCDSGDGAACGTLGKRAEGDSSSSDWDPDYAAAAKYFVSGCVSGDGASCVDAGRLLKAGLPKKNEAAALRAHDVGCEHLQWAPACSVLASHYDYGKHANAAKAALYSAKACEFGDAASCVSVSLSEKDATESFALLRKACRFGYAQACLWIAEKYANGDTVKKSAVRAKLLIRKGASLARVECEKMNTPTVCDAVATLYLKGKSVKKNPALALRFYTLACKSGVAAATCATVGTLYLDGQGIKRDPARAFGAFLASCAPGVYDYCVTFGDMFRDGKNVPKNTRRARALYKKGCKLGDKKSCARAKLLGAAGQ